MKRSLLIACALVTCFGVTAMAQTSHSSRTSGSHQKIAVVLFQAAVAGTNEGQTDLQNLEKKFEPKRQQLKDESDQIVALKKQLQAQAKTLSAADRQEKIDEINEKERSLQQQAQDSSSDFRDQWGTTFNALAQKVGAVMTSYAEAHGYSMVLDASGNGSAVLWANPTTNITKAVIAAYNKKSGVPAPPPSAPTPASTSRAGSSGK